MSNLRNKIGQMLIMGFSGCEIDEQSPVAQWLKKDGLGGVLLFDEDLITKTQGKNLRDREQIKRLNQQLHDYANQAEHAKKHPLLIALDYEGGAVDRLTCVAGCRTTIPAYNQALLDDEALYQEAEAMAITLEKLGFNLNFAPVVDLNLTEKKGIIGKLGRSFSSQPESVIRAARQFVKAFAHHGIICTYKHFPGHGSALGDTHAGFVDVTDTYHPSELEPYTALIADTEPPAMIMTAHVINRHLDASGLPATLSFAILTRLLREKLAFNGVIVSDDLQMHAISKHYSLDEALTLTINAGADMLIFGNQLGTISATEVIDRIEYLVHSAAIPQAKIEEAYQRICHLKKQQSTQI